MNTRVTAVYSCVLVCLVSVSVAVEESPDFSRYQVIVDKHLFGEPLPEVVPASAQPPVPPPKPFVDTLRLCGITEERDSAYVSMVDVGVNPNKSSYLKVGEEGDGIKVLQADVVGGRALLKKGDEERWLSMDQPAPAAPTPVRTLGAPGPSFMRTAPPAPVAPVTVNSGAMASPSSTSIAERLRQRREALERMKAAATSPPPPAVVAPTNTAVEMTPQERMKKLREYNLELIKAKGAKGPPLPIQLTPEEDDQLVKEGVLPPQAATPSPEPPQ